MTENAVHVSPTATAKAPTATAKAPSATAKAPAAVSPKEAGFGKRHRNSYLLAVGIGVVMAIIAPLGTDQIALLPRFAYWQILMLSGATLGLGITELVERWGRLSRWPWLEVPLIGTLIALPLTMIVMGTGAMFFGAQASGVFRFSYNFGITALISIAVTALGHAINGNKAVEAPAPLRAIEAATQTTPPPNPEANRFAERLPLPLRTLPIIALQAEDHYLRVHLEGGQSTLILLRLSDAIAELPTEAGAQTHRSWWVAKHAVRSVAKADGRATLKLDGGTEAPVSRSFYKALGHQGWLA
jgi:LytTr DNA-binding domain